MAQTHKASATIGRFDLPKNTGIRSGMMIEAYKGNTKLGDLEIGQGSVRWYSKNAKDGNPTVSLSWSAFAALMEKDK